MKQIIYVTESLHENDFEKSLNKSQYLQNIHLKLFFQKFLHSKYANITSSVLQRLNQITNYQIQAEGFSDINELDEIKFGQSIESLIHLNHLQIAAGDQITSNFILGVLEGLKKLHKLESFNLYIFKYQKFQQLDLLQYFKMLQNYLEFKVAQIFLKNNIQLDSLYTAWRRDQKSSITLKIIFKFPIKQFKQFCTLEFF
ncbi:hypothetical protein ABPG72_020221 [Tetrahymena utriculariae]